MELSPAVEASYVRRRDAWAAVARATRSGDRREIAAACREYQVAAAEFRDLIRDDRKAM